MFKKSIWWRKNGWGKLLQERVDVDILRKVLARETKID
jgi:hypothetical protein